MNSPYSASLPTISSTALSQLAMYGPRPIAPGLLLLRFHDYELKDSPGYTARFLAPSLTTLHLTMSNPKVHFPTYIGAVARACPHVEELVLECDPATLTAEAAEASRRADRALARMPNRQVIAPEGDPALPARPGTYCCTMTSFRDLGLLDLVQLRMLHLTEIYSTVGAVPQLAKLPHLEELSLCLAAPRRYNFDVPVGKRKPAFRALKRLYVRVDDFVLATAVLAHAPSACLQRFYVTCEMPEGSSRSVVDNDDLKLFFRTVAAHPGRDSLQVLWVYVNPIQLPCDLSAALRPLLGIGVDKTINPVPGCLTHLEMDGWASITVNDVTLEAMARAWPGLECLNLCQPARYERLEKNEGEDGGVRIVVVVQPPQATLRGLVPLALSCPRLHTINLEIDARCTELESDTAGSVHTSSPPGMGRWGDVDRDVDWVSDRPAISQTISPRQQPEKPLPPVLPEDSALVRLYVGVYREAHDPTKIASLLSGLFPHLQSVAHGYEDGVQRQYAAGWRRVEEQLKVFGRIRMQERRWRSRFGAGKTQQRDRQAGGNTAIEGQESGDSRTGPATTGGQ